MLKNYIQNISFKPGVKFNLISNWNQFGNLRKSDVIILVVNKKHFIRI